MQTNMSQFSDSLCAQQMRMLRLDLPVSSEAEVARLHSKYDPWEEARRQLGQIESRPVVLAFGAGLGYTIALLLRSGKECIWFESDPRILSRALGTVDLQEFIQSGRLRVVRRISNEEELEEIFRGRGNDDISFFSHRNFLTETHAEWKRKIEFFLNKKSVNMATLSRFEGIWARNLVANMPLLLRGQPVSTLFGIHSNKPAIVVGAGPSLSDSIGDLEKVRQKAVLVCVDTALAVLRHEGIDPDYVVTVDPQPVNRCYLEGYDGEALIVADPTASRFALRHVVADRIRYFWSPFAMAQVFFEAIGVTAGEIAFGGSVSTNAYDLARKMGCDPVFVTGQDLSFPDGEVHCKGATLEERLNWKESRTFRRELHNYRQLSALPPVLLPGLTRASERTNDKLVIFYRWFERRFRKDLENGLRIRNCTARGARFDFLERAQLSELAGLPDAMPGPQMIRANDVSDKARKLLLVLESLEADFASTSKELELAVQIIRKEGPPKKTGETLDRVDEELRKRKNALAILGNASQKAIHAVTESAHGGERALELYEALYSASLRYERWLKRSIRILSETLVGIAR